MRETAELASQHPRGAADGPVGGRHPAPRFHPPWSRLGFIAWQAANPSEQRSNVCSVSIISFSLAPSLDESSVSSDGRALRAASSCLLYATNALMQASKQISSPTRVSQLVLKLHIFAARKDCYKDEQLLVGRETQPGLDLAINMSMLSLDYT